MRQTDYYPAHAYKETGAARVGRIRRQTAGRMRELSSAGGTRAARTRRPWTVRSPTPCGMPFSQRSSTARTASAIPVREILLRISGQLVARSRRDAEAGRDVVVYDKKAVAEAVHKRLLQSPRARHAVTEIAVSKSKSNGEVEDLIFDDVD